MCEANSAKRHDKAAAEAGEKRIVLTFLLQCRMFVERTSTPDKWVDYLWEHDQNLIAKEVLHYAKLTKERLAPPTLHGNSVVAHQKEHAKKAGSALSSKEKAEVSAEISRIRGGASERKQKALDEIRKYQNGVDMVVLKAPMKRLILEILQDNSPVGGVKRAKKDAVEAIHVAAEAFLVELFQEAMCAMVHGKRVTLMKRDIDLVRVIKRDHPDIEPSNLTGYGSS